MRSSGRPLTSNILASFLYRLREVRSALPTHEICLWRWWWWLNVSIKKPFMILKQKTSEKYFVRHMEISTVSIYVLHIIYVTYNR